jgi:hypothetical protein
MKTRGNCDFSHQYRKKKDPFWSIYQFHVKKKKNNKTMFFLLCSNLYSIPVSKVEIGNGNRNSMSAYKKNKATFQCFVAIWFQ